MISDFSTRNYERENVIVAEMNAVCASALTFYDVW